MLSTLLYFVLALLLLVTVHEYGHFIVARCCGVKVLRFSFGFGKVLAGFHDRRGTEYTWSLIPLGGYVKMLDETEEDVPENERHMAFNNKSVWARMAIVLAGPMSNFMFAFVALWLVLIIGFKAPAPIIADVLPASPAKMAGLQVGDVIKSIDGNVIDEWMTLVQFVRKHPDQDSTLQIERHGQPVKIAVHIGEVKQADHREGYLGVHSQDPEHWVRMHQEGALPALGKAFKQTVDLTGTTFVLVGRLVTGNLPWNSISGPVGIAQGAGQSARMGLPYYLFFLALVSISLGTLNLLPIPMLDGGHLLYYLVEAVLRRPVPNVVKSVGSYIGMGLLVMLMIVALHNDMTRLAG